MKSPLAGRKSVEGPLRHLSRKKRPAEIATGPAHLVSPPKRFQLHTLTLRVRKGSA